MCFQAGNPTAVPKSSKPRGPCEVPPIRNITKNGPNSSLCSPMKGNQKVARLSQLPYFFVSRKLFGQFHVLTRKMNGWNLNITKFKRKVIIKTSNLGSMLIFQGVFTHEKTTNHPVTAVFELPIVHILLQGLRVGLPCIYLPKINIERRETPLWKRKYISTNHSFLEFHFLQGGYLV